MEIEQMIITFRGMEPSDALRDYVLEKFGKYKPFLVRATSMEAILIETVHNKGIAQDFKIEVTVVLPRSVLHCDEVGENMYALVDKSADVMARQLRKYHDEMGA